MAIVKMKKLRIIIPRAQKDELMRQLLLLGCVEPDSQDCLFDDPQLSGLIKREYTDASPQAVQRELYAAALRVLDRLCPQKTPMLSPREEISPDMVMDDAEEAKFKSIAKEIDLLGDKLKQLGDDEVREKLLIDSLTPWKSCDIPLEYNGTRYTRLFFGTLPADADMDLVSAGLSEKVPEAAILPVSHDDNAHYLALLCHEAVSEDALALLREHSFAIVSFEASRGCAAELIRSGTEYLDQIARERQHTLERISALAVHRHQLRLCFDRCCARIDRIHSEALLLSTEKAMLLSGWIPVSDLSGLETLLRQFDCAYELSDPVEDEYPSVPVKLKNGPLTNGMNMVTTMYSLPQYGTVDANPLMAPFFILFYGIMMADMGYGLVMMLIGALVCFRMRPAEGFLKYFGLLMLEGGAATFVMGALTGGFFGDAPTHVVRLLTGHEFALPSLFDPLNDTIMVLIGAIILGFIHLNAGMAVSFYMKLRDGKLADALWYEGMLWLVFICAALAFAGFGSINGLPLPLIISITLFLAGAGRGKKGFGRITAAFSAIYSELTGWFGDLLSYARLMALMLAGSVIAQVFNTLGAMPGNLVVFIIIALLGNTLNFGLNLIGCYVHDLRLQCLEFFNKFYTDGGRPFRPLRVTSKFYTIKNK